MGLGKRMTSQSTDGWAFMSPSQVFFFAADKDEFRQKLRSQSNVRFVDRLEFRRLLVSYRWLTRANVPKANVLGLQDPTSGIRYLIEEEILFDGD